MLIFSFFFTLTLPILTYLEPVILIDNFEIQDGGRNHNVLTQHIGEMFVDRVLPFINFYYDKAFTTSIIGIREVIDDTEWQDTITNSNVVFSLIIVYYPNSKLHKLYAVALKNSILLCESVYRFQYNKHLSDL